MVSIVKYGQNIDLSKVVALNGKKSLTLDNLVLNNTIKIKIPAGIKYVSSLEENDLKIEFKDEEGNILELILKDMSTLLAQNDGFTLVELIEVLADGSEKTLGSIIDIASALQASAAGPAAGANAQSDSGVTPDTLDDLLSSQNNINNAVINNARLNRATPDAEDAGNSFITQNNVPTIELIEAQTTDEDNSITISYNAVDPDGDTLIPSVTATNGTAVIDANGDIVFTPTEDFNGVAQVTLSVNDGTATTSQTFDVTVNPVNDAPTIEPILTQTVDEDGSKTITFSANDIDGDILTSSVTATDGTAVIDANGDIVFTPNENFNGTAQVTLSVNDGTVTTSQSFNVIVNSTNDQPIVENIDINNIVTTTTPVVDEEISEFARHTTVNGEVFLGGEFIELGIHNSGSFGTSGSKPAGFYGTDDDSRLGMTSDADGFNQGEDLAIDYFLPGSPEEAWNIGYKIDDVATIATNAGLEGSYEISNFVNTDTSVGNTLSSHGTGSLNDTLQTDIDVSFGATSDYYVTTVTLTNISTTSIDDVRYMRSFDPDNTVYAGGDYTTVNTIEKTFEAGDGSALVSAVSLPDAYSALSGDTAKIFFYSEEPTAKVTSTGFDLRDVYASDVYDNTLAKGDSITSDTAISIAFDVGTLAAGESTTVVYYTSLTNREISTVVDEIKVSGLDVYEGYLPVATDTLPAVDAEFTETNLLTGLLSVEDADVDDLGLHTFHIEKDSSGENIITIEQTPTNEDGNDILLPSDVIVDTVKNADGTWNYTINGDFSALAWDEEATISFKYYADDTRGFDGSDPLNESSISELKTITFVVKGTNGLPIVEEITLDTVSETNGIETIYEGNLTVQDEDVNDSHIFIVSTPISSSISLDSLTLTIIDAQAGLYKVEGDFDKLSTDEIATITFGYKAIDSSNSTIGESKESAEQIVTLTVKGTNDAAVVSSESVELIETNDILTTSGLLTSTDVDNMDNSFTANTIVGSTGTFTINELGAWTYSANSAFNELNETQNVNETFEVTSIDGTTSFVKIQINGTNDAPIVLSETIADPINEATLNPADITLLDSVVVDITAKDFSFDITNATIVSLFDTLNIESQIKSAISLALDNMPLEDIDFSITKTDGKIAIDASVPDYDGVTPLNTIITQENLNIVLLDHLGSAFNLPFENAVHTGQITANDVDNDALTLSLGDVRLEVTSSNKYLITLFEQLTGASPELSLSYIQELASDLLGGYLISDSSEPKVITIPATAVTLLQTAGLLTISLDDSGEYKVISPLFNTMKETDSIEISFDYTANDGELNSNLGTTTFTIQGTNDAPILLEESITVETELVGTSYEGTLQGAYNLNMFKTVYDNVGDATAVANVIDQDELQQAILDNILSDIDVTLDDTKIAQMKAELLPDAFASLGLTNDDILASLTSMTDPMTDDINALQLQLTQFPIDVKASVYTNLGSLTEGSSEELALDLAIATLMSDIQTEIATNGISNISTAIETIGTTFVNQLFTIYNSSVDLDNLTQIQADISAIQANPEALAISAVVEAIEAQIGDTSKTAVLTAEVTQLLAAIQANSTNESTLMEDFADTLFTTFDSSVNTDDLTSILTSLTTIQADLLAKQNNLNTDIKNAITTTAESINSSAQADSTALDNAIIQYLSDLENNVSTANTTFASSIATTYVTTSGVIFTQAELTTILAAAGSEIQELETQANSLVSDIVNAIETQIGDTSHTSELTTQVTTLLGESTPDLESFANSLFITFNASVTPADLIAINASVSNIQADPQALVVAAIVESIETEIGSGHTVSLTTLVDTLLNDITATPANETALLEAFAQDLFDEYGATVTPEDLTAIQSDLTSSGIALGASILNFPSVLADTLIVDVLEVTDATAAQTTQVEAWVKDLIANASNPTFDQTAESKTLLINTVALLNLDLNTVILDNLPTDITDALTTFEDSLNIDQATVLANIDINQVLVDLGIDINNIDYQAILASAQTELTDYAKTLSLNDLKSNPDAISDTFKGILDTAFSILDTTIDDLVPVTDEDLKDAMISALSTAIIDQIDMDDLITALKNNFGKTDETISLNIESLTNPTFIATPSTSGISIDGVTNTLDITASSYTAGDEIKITVNGEDDQGSPTSLEFNLVVIDDNGVLKVSDTPNYDNLSESIIESVVTELTQDINLSIDEIKEVLKENIFTQIGLDTDLLDDDARDGIADKMVQDMYDRLGMDEDFQDIATLKYELSGTPTVIIKDENDVIQTLATETTVEIDPSYGTFTISNPEFENINTLWTAEVSFDYIVTDAESDSNTQTVNVTLDFVDSTVSDGYISGALVFEDLDGDKVHDANEQSTYTDENGDFYLDTDAALVATGGTDISTGLAFTGTLTAPAGSKMLTPITTLLQNLIETSDPVLTLEEASVKVKSALGIDSSINLITYDSYGTAKDENSSEEEKIQAQEVQEVAVQLATLMTQESSALNSLATIIEGDNDVDLTSTQTLENVLINATPEEIEAIANINTAIQSANSVDLISNIQIIVEDVIEQANNGTVLDSDNIYNMADNLVPNELPTLEVIDTITVDEDSNTSITFTANDSDGTIENVTASSANADIVVDGSQITYTPNPNYNGIDEITIIATDDDNETVTKIITVSVTPTNDAPTIETIAMQEVDEDASKSIIFIASDVDIDATLTSSITAVTNGEATISGNIITYTPDANYNGDALITLSVTDGLETTTRTINVTVNPVNDAPIIETIATQTVDEDNVKTITFTASDIDIDTTLTPSVEATNGETTVSGNEITFTPDENFNGTATVTLSVTDGTTTTTQAFDVTVNPINDAPIIETIATQKVDEDNVKTITFTASDIDIDTTLTPSVTATNGEAIINEDGNIVFTPTANFNGIAEITLSVTDGIETITQTFNVTVTSENDAPTIEEIAIQTVDEDGNKTITFEASDIDDDKLIASADALNGEATISGNEIIYAPTEDFVGTDTITLTVNDGKGGITTKDITIEVEALPVLSINSQTITESDTATFTATLSKASDIDTVFEVSIPSETIDVETTTQTLTILAGQTSVDFTIASLDDEIAEAQEDFTVQADVISGNVKNQVAQSTLTLVDNDELSIYTSDIEVNEEDGTAIITVSLSTISEEQITVDYITQDSSATAGSDYEATSGTLTFEAGTTQMNITVPLTDDSIYDTNESFELVLSNPINAAISDGTAIVNIKDADITASINLDENVTEDNIINIEESQNNIMITGTVTQYAQVGDSVTLTVNDKVFTGSVQEGLIFAILVPGADLIADSNSTIDAQVEVSDESASFVANDSITYSVDTAIVGTPSVTITQDDNNDGYISSTEISDTVNVLVTVGANTNIGDTLTITNLDATQTDYEVTAEIITDGLLLEYANVEENVDFSVNAQVTTASGNISEVATSTVTVDTQASNPVLIDAQNSANSVNISISIPVGTMVGDILTVIDPLGESIDYEVTEEMINTGFTTSYSYDSLTHGDTYEVSSFTTDSAGNVSETTAHSFLVNNAPVIQDVNLDLDAQSYDVTFQGNLPGSELSVLFNSEDNFNRRDLLKSVETDLISKVTVTPDISMLNTSNILASTQIAFGISNEDIISNIIVDKISTDVNMIVALNNLDLDDFISINAVTLLSVSIMTETLGIDSSNNSTLNTELIGMIYSNTEFRTALEVIQANTELSSEEKLTQAKALLVVEITPFFSDVLANPEFNINQETIIATNMPTDLSSATSDLVSSISNTSNHQFFDGWENGDGDFIGSTTISFDVIPNDSLLSLYKSSIDSVLENINTEDLLTNPSIVEATFKNALDTNINLFISSINALEIDQEELTSSLIENILMDIKYSILDEELTEYRTQLETLFGPLDDNLFDSYINQMITSTLADSIILDVQDVKDSLIENILDASGIDSNLINEEARAELASIYTQSLIERALIDSDSDDISYIFNDEVSIVTTIIDSEGNESILEGTNVTVNSDGSYTISNASLDDPELAGFDVRVTFDYLVEDSDGGLSETKTVTVEIDREDLIDNTPYLNTEISDETIDGNRTLVIDSNIGETSILDSVKIFVDGANEDSTLEFGDSVVEVQVATQPENVNITEDGFVITSGDIDSSFVMPALSNNTTFYSFSNDGNDESQEFYVEEINFDNNQLNLTYKDLGGETELIEGIELSDEDSDGKIEVSANWGTDELTFLDAKQVTNINGTDVSTLGISQVTVMMEILEQGNVEDTDDWWDASWYGVTTISELLSILGDSRSVYTEKGSYSLNVDSSLDIPSGTIRNSNTGETVSGNWQLTAAGMLIITIDGEGIVAFKEEDGSIVMTEIAAVGTIEENTWYYGDALSLSAMEALVSNGITSLETFDYPEYIENAPSDYYFNIEGSDEIAEALENEITITNVDDEVNVITKVETSSILDFPFEISNNSETYTSAIGDTTLNLTDEDDTFTLEDSTASFIDAGEGEDTLDLTQEDSNLDMSTLLQNISLYNIENIDMTSDSAHILSNFTLDEFISLTDEDNTLKILGDDADSIQLDAEQRWEQHIVDGVPYKEDGDFNVYFAYNEKEDQTLKLLIEDNITVENV